jgi:hypothetical protein
VVNGPGFFEPALLAPPIFSPIGPNPFRLAAVGSPVDAPRDFRALAPFELPQAEQVAGVTETAKPALKEDDDCVPTPKAIKAAVDKDRVKVKPKAKTMVRPALSEFMPAKKLNFSESLKQASKRFKPPIKVVPPAAPEKIC